MMFQELLEKYKIPFVGTGSSECCQAFDKVRDHKLDNDCYFNCINNFNIYIYRKS